jgi:phage tail tape-measure protein
MFADFGSTHCRANTTKGSIMTAEKESADDTARKHALEAGGGVAGAIGGAGLGILAGPPGIAAGAVIGGVVGALTGWAMNANNAEVAATEKRLDEDIGVSGGPMGVASLKHPAVAPGHAYSAEAMGAGTSTEDSDAEPAEGLIPPAD